MAKRLLKVGDIFLIEKGQTLYAGRDEQEVIAGEPTEQENKLNDIIRARGITSFTNLEERKHNV